MLTATAITKDYHSRVLDNISLSIPDGQFVAIMGPSGSGKTTLLHIISGLDRPTNGTVLFDDHPLSDLSETALAHLRLTTFGFVFQQPHLMDSLTIGDNIILPGFLAGLRPRDEVIADAQELMNKVGIGELTDRPVSDASGGQLQRAGICRALINHPKVLFGDEPTGALNSATSAHILNIFHTIHDSGTTIVLVTHDPVVALHADRVLILADGAITADEDLGAYQEEHHTERFNRVTELMAAHGV